MHDVIAFADRHPWWLLVYLAVVATGIRGVVSVRIKRAKSEHRSTSETRR